MAVCRILSVTKRETDRAVLLGMLPTHLHDELNAYLDATGSECFNYVTFDKVFDIRALKIDVATLLKEGHLENPLVAIKPGKKRPQNLGQGCVQVVSGVCCALLQFLERSAEVICPT